LTAFNRRIAELLTVSPRIGVDGSLSPALLTLAPDARTAWVAFHDAIEAELRSGGELFDVRDVASKTADNAARLSALFHFLEHGTQGAIGASHFEGASRIAAWHLNEARRFFGELALPAELANAARLDSWLIDYCRQKRTHFMPTRKVQQFGPPGLREKATIATATRELEELDRARLVPDGRRKLIQLNPALLTGGEA
jgi:putative DNA primase/helicase